jgi:hypothetical protein
MREMEENKDTPLKMQAERPIEEPIEAQMEPEFDARMEDLFEQRLSAALQRVDAPAGFADRVVQRASETQAGPLAKVVAMPLRMPRRTHVWMTGSIAAALLLGALLGGDAYRRHEHAVADREFAISQRITEQTLEQTRQQLAEQGIRLDD